MPWLRKQEFIYYYVLNLMFEDSRPQMGFIFEITNFKDTLLINEFSLFLKAERKGHVEFAFDRNIF